MLARAADPAGPWSGRGVLNVSHAGGDLEAPHSTLYAMKTGVRAGGDVLEMDVRLSADGQLVVHHDDTVDRTTEATGLAATMTLAELQALDNAYWFVPDCWSCRDRAPEAYRLRGIRTGERPPPPGFTADDFRIPSLLDVVNAFPHRLLDIEIKGSYPADAATADALAAFIAERGIADRVLVASFDAALLGRFKELAPEVATSPSLDEMVEWFATRGPLPQHAVLQVPPMYGDIEVVTRQLVEDAHANGLAVWVWFNGNDDDSPVVWDHLIDLGVDGLVTGKPQQAQRTIAARGVVVRSAPELPATAPVAGGVARVRVACPGLHVDRCRSRLVFGLDGRVAGTADVAVARGRTRRVMVDLAPWARRAVAGGALPVTAIAFPVGDDTAPALRRVVLRST